MFNKIIANDRGVVGIDAFLTGGGDPRGGGIGDGRHQAKRSKNNKNKNENNNKNNSNNIADDRRVGGIDACFISGGGDPRGGAEVSATVDNRVLAIRRLSPPSRWVGLMAKRQSIPR